MNQLAIALSAVCLSGCNPLGGSTFVVRDAQTGVIVNEARVRGNLGLKPDNFDSDSSGGLTSLVTGNARGTRRSAFSETENPGEIVVGQIRLAGTIDHSTRLGLFFDGLNGIVRKLVTGFGISKLFGFAESRIAEQEATKRAGDAAAADVELERIATQGKVDRLNARSP